MNLKRDGPLYQCCFQSFWIWERRLGEPPTCLHCGRSDNLTVNHFFYCPHLLSRRTIYNTPPNLSSAFKNNSDLTTRSLQYLLPNSFLYWLRECSGCKHLHKPHSKESSQYPVGISSVRIPKLLEITHNIGFPHLLTNYLGKLFSPLIFHFSLDKKKSRSEDSLPRPTARQPTQFHIIHHLHSGDPFENTSVRRWYRHLPQPP